MFFITSDRSIGLIDPNDTYIIHRTMFTASSMLATPHLSLPSIPCHNPFRILIPPSLLLPSFSIDASLVVVPLRPYTSPYTVSLLTTLNAVISKSTCKGPAFMLKPHA